MCDRNYSYFCGALLFNRGDNDKIVNGGDENEWMNYILVFWENEIVSMAICMAVRRGGGKFCCNEQLACKRIISSMKYVQTCWPILCVTGFNGINLRPKFNYITNLLGIGEINRKNSLPFSIAHIAHWLKVWIHSRCMKTVRPRVMQFFPLLFNW